MLDIEQIKEKIKNPVSESDLRDGISIQNKHKVHITGEGFSLKQLVGFESKGDYDIRKQLTEPATMQICALILDNLNRWVTNPGTVKIVKFKQENQTKDFKAVLDQIWRGDSLENFIRTFYKEAIYQEMEGFLLITKPFIDGGVQIREGVELKYEGNALDPYVIFIAAEDVHDFNSIGDSLEYLIIKQDEVEGKKIYRVIDDTQDTIVVFDKQQDTVTVAEDGEAIHGLDYTPAIQISSITKKLDNDKIKTSPIDHVIPALSRYMQKDSDLIIQMVRHMYPKLASVTTQCLMCDGQGYYYPTTGDIKTKVKCNECNGTGKTIPITRDGVLGMPQYIDDGKTPYPGSPASYITPDNASLQIAIDDLKNLAQDIMYSATGDKNIVAESLNTATENLINYKGLEDRISEIIEMVESREEFIVETVARMHLDFQNGFEGVSVRYGRRLSIRGENEIMTEIGAAKDSGMPSSHIEALQKELIYARYKNNKTELERQQLLADLEPLNGYTVKDVSDIKEFVSVDDLQLKYNFNTVVDTFEATHGLIHEYMKETEWKKRISGIREKFDEILQSKGISRGDGEQDVPAPDSE